MPCGQQLKSLDVMNAARRLSERSGWHGHTHGRARRKERRSEKRKVKRREKRKEKRRPVAGKARREKMAGMPVKATTATR
eukprot:3128129-Prymnesium_polylepis.1